MTKKNIKVKLDKGAYMPERAHEHDAGLDIRTPVRVCVYPGENCVIETGVHVAIPEGYVGMIKSKSGINFKKHCICEGVIDAGYTGQIQVKMYNLSPLAHVDCYKPVVTFEPGDKIAQLVIMPIETPGVTVVSDLEDTERGDNGFGSTGK